MAISKETILSVVNSIGSKVETFEHRGQLSLIIPKERLLEIAKVFRDNPDTQFDMLTDITAIDWNTPHNRFEVIYFLYSNVNNERLRLKVSLQEYEPVCPSVSEIWESANWYERETFDMYGIKFEGHPFLRRFYMPEDFTDPISGEPLHPLRKDFPLMGVPGALPLPPYPEKYGELD